MKLVDIQSHLKSAGIFSKVEAILSIDQVSKQQVRKPVAFVTPTGTTGQESSQDVGPNLQKVTETYAVIYCIPAVNDPTGEKASAELQKIIKETRRSMLGFAPHQAEKMQLTSGEMISIDGGFAIWQDQFTTKFYIEE